MIFNESIFSYARHKNIHHVGTLGVLPTDFYTMWLRNDFNNNRSIDKNYTTEYLHRIIFCGIYSCAHDMIKKYIIINIMR